MSDCLGMDSQVRLSIPTFNLSRLWEAVLKTYNSVPAEHMVFLGCIRGSWLLAPAMVMSKSIDGNSHNLTVQFCLSAAQLNKNNFNALGSLVQQLRHWKGDHISGIVAQKVNPPFGISTSNIRT